MKLKIVKNGLLLLTVIIPSYVVSLEVDSIGKENSVNKIEIKQAQISGKNNCDEDWEAIKNYAKSKVIHWASFWVRSFVAYSIFASGAKYANDGCLDKEEDRYLFLLALILTLAADHIESKGPTICSLKKPQQDKQQAENKCASCA